MSIKQDTTPVDDTQVIINFLAPLERAYSRIWESPNPLPSSYWDRHANMGEFLNDNGNPFLQSANTYFLVHIIFCQLFNCSIVFFTG
jgi:hypothetical protein